MTDPDPSCSWEYIIMNTTSLKHGLTWSRSVIKSFPDFRFPLNNRIRRGFSSASPSMLSLSVSRCQWHLESPDDICGVSASPGVQCYVVVCATSRLVWSNQPNLKIFILFFVTCNVLPNEQVLLDRNHYFIRINIYKSSYFHFTIWIQNELQQFHQLSFHASRIRSPRLWSSVRMFPANKINWKYFLGFKFLCLSLHSKDIWSDSRLTLHPVDSNNSCYMELFTCRKNYC